VSGSPGYQIGRCQNIFVDRGIGFSVMLRRLILLERPRFLCRHSQKFASVTRGPCDREMRRPILLRRFTIMLHGRKSHLSFVCLYPGRQHPPTWLYQAQVRTFWQWGFSSRSLAILLYSYCVQIVELGMVFGLCIGVSTPSLFSRAHTYNFTSYY
jgi:hypothetical protein